MAQSGQPLFGIDTTNGGRIAIFAGGIPPMRAGEVVDAIGVSGGTIDKDHEVAEAGVAAFGQCLYLMWVRAPMRVSKARTSASDA
jgi:uncharacterized protein GlcG (DUF336 family)